MMHAGQYITKFIRPFRRHQMSRVLYTSGTILCERLGENIPDDPALQERRFPQPANPQAELDQK